MSVEDFGKPGAQEERSEGRIEKSKNLPFAPMTMLGPGSWILFPSALRLACQRFFMAKPPRAIASEEPVVAVPVADSF